MRAWFILALLVPTLALADGFDSGRSPVAGGSGTAADGTAFVVQSVPDTAASAVGTDAIAVGDGAVSGNAASDNSTVAIGRTSTATGTNSTAIGEDTDATGSNSIAIGGHVSGGAQSSGTSAVAVGNGANASGATAIAIGQVAVASADDAVTVGRAVASAARSIAIGRNTDATGTACIAIGGDLTDTDTADCSAANSAAIGNSVIADDIGEFAFASGEFAAQSDAHTSVFVLRNNTTDATQTELFADGSAGDISVPSDCTVAFDALITARQTDADDVSAGYTFFGVIDNNAGTTALVGSLGTVTTIGEDVAGWDVTATADDTNDGINILVTGAAGDAVQWVARVEVVETCG